MLENGRGLIKALENWAKKVTSDYRDVNVRDLSTSFRDGLAFCAIIHHYRPDLINFESLSKENIFENNSLAFSTAEKQLGVPALLDAEDMVKYARPDRLSIITYLSQLRNCFENQNKVKKHDLKRIQKSSAGPPAKVPVVEPILTSSRRHEMCQVCKHHVFILERLIVDGKLYHTTCFRCHKCNTLLNPGAYVESDTPGLYECSVCPDEGPESPETDNETLEEHPTDKFEDFETCISKTVNVPEKEFGSKEALSFVKSNLNQDSPISARPNIHLYPLKDSEPDFGAKQNVKEISSSVKARINAFEKNQEKEKTLTPTSNILCTPGNKFQHSPVTFNHKESESSPLSSRFSARQSLICTKSPEESDNKSQNDTSFSKNLFAKDTSPKKELNGTNLNGNVKMEVSDDTCSDMDLPLNQVPNEDSKTSSNEIKTLNKENGSFEVISSNESPKSPRDIFKSSLPPLKLSLSPLKKEPSKSPITSPESGNIDIPQIKSSYPVPLPRSIIGGNLSLRKLSPEIKQSNSESSLNNNTNQQDQIIRSPVKSNNESVFNNNLSQSSITRRSSLESHNESNSKESCDKFLSGTNSKSFQRTNSSHEISSLPDADLVKTGVRNYTSVYKNIYSTSNIAERNKSKLTTLGSYSSLKSQLSSDAVCVEKQQTEKDIGVSEDFDTSINSVTKTLSEARETSNVEPTDNLKDSFVSDADQQTSSKEAKEDEEYPDDLNPFGDDELDEHEEEYPDDLNPFGDDDEIVNSTDTVISYDESKNPFASDEDEEEEAEVLNETSIFSVKNTFENKTCSFQDSVSSVVSSPSGSLKGTIKKRQAPRPPNMSDIFPKDSLDLGADSSFNSLKTSPSISKRSFSTSSPKARKSKPAPPPPVSVSPSVQDPTATVKRTKETDNMKLKSSLTEDKEQLKQYKKKKRPAPPVPIPFRRDMKKIPLKEIIQEMKEIEEKQREYERQGREIELLIRDRDKDEEPSVEEEEYIMQLFDLVNQKNALFRRQAELMYIKRSQRLEEQQYRIEKEIRQLMEKPESEKTDEDRQKEEELTMELIDIVDQRNSIIDSIEMDRRRELEEDHSVQEQLEIKNGDSFTAEIKQKGKNKKNKAKKEKKEKKKQAEDESGKGTLKRKKILFTKRS